jgi:hypothetical protein
VLYWYTRANTDAKELHVKQIVASDGKAKSGSRKKQRKEEEEAEKVRQSEARAQEYAKWRAAQLAEFDSRKKKELLPAARQNSMSAGADGQDEGRTAGEAGGCVPDGITHAQASAPAASASAAPAPAAPASTPNVPAAKQSCILSFVKSARVGRGEEHGSSSAANENVAESSPLEDSCAAAVRQRLAAAAEARALQEH